MGPDQLCALLHELKSEVAAAASRDRSDIEPSAVVANREDPFLISNDARDDDR